MMRKKIPFFVVVYTCIAAVAVTAFIMLLVLSPGGKSTSYDSSDRTSFNGISSGMSASTSGGSKGPVMNDSVSFAPAAGAEGGSFDYIESDSKPAEDVSAGRKLIRRASVSVETTEYDEYLEWLQDYVASSGGYFENKEQYNWENGYYDRDYRTLSATIRVPVSRIDALLDSLSLNGNVTSKRESQDDITDQYTDTDAHLESIRIEQKRLNELLEIAESVEDILSIEDRLSYVRYEVERYERQLRTYDSQIEYSIVTVELTEVLKYTEPAPEGFFSRCWSALQENLEWLAEFSQDSAVFVFGHIPTILIGAVVIFASIKVYSKRKESTPQIDTEKEQEQDKQ